MRSVTPRRGAIAVLAALAPLVIGAALRAQDEPLPLPETHTCRLRIADPVPHLTTLLQCDEVRLLCRGGAIGDAFKALANIDDPDPARLAAGLQLVADRVPAAIELGAPPRSLALGPDIVAFGYITTLMGATFELSDQDDATADRERLRKELLELFSNVLDSPASARITFREAAGADALFDGISDIADALASMTAALQVTHRGDGVRIAFAPGNDLDRDDVVSFLEETVYVVDRDDPAVDEYWRWAASRSVALDVGIDEHVVRLQFGAASPTKSGHAAVATPEPPPITGGQPLVHFSIDYRALHQRNDRLRTLWQQWRETALGTIAQTLDTERLIDDVATVVHTLETLPTASAGWLVRSNTGLRWQIRSSDEPGVDLRGSAILRLLPPNAAWYSFDGRSAAHDPVIETFQNAESRLSTAWMRATTAAEAETADEKITAWFDAIGPFRDLLTTEAERLWTPPTGMIVTCGPDDGGTALSARPGALIVATFQEPAGGLPLARRLFDAIANVSDGDLVTRELELGVPSAACPIPAVLIKLYGETMVPHAFEVGSFLVFSSNLDASRELLASRDLERDLGLSEDREVLHCSATTGARLALTTARLGDALANLLAIARPNADDDRRIVSSMAMTAGAIAGGLELLGPIRATVERYGGSSLTRGEIQFVANMDLDPSALLTAARRAIGAWPDGATALEARGTGRYAGGPSSFVLSATRHGGIANTIDGPIPEATWVSDDESWLVQMFYGRSAPGAVGLAGLQGLMSTATGTWTEPRSGVRLVRSPDVLPGDGPRIELWYDGVPSPMTIVLDPATMLPRRLLHGRCIGSEARDYEISDYREVNGRMLPHRIVGAEGDTRFDIREWRTVRKWQEPALPAALTAEPELDGDPDIDFEPDRVGIPMVRIATASGSAWVIVNPAFPGVAVSPAGARRLGLAHESGTATTPLLRCGPIVRRNCPILISDQAPSGPADAPEPNPQGIIGSALVGGVCIEMDFEEPSCRAFTAGHFDDSKAGFMPLEMSGMPFVMANLGKGPPVRLALAFYGSGSIVFDDAGPPPELLVGRRVQHLGEWSTRTGRVAATWPSVHLGDVALGEQRISMPHCRVESTRPFFSGHFGRQLAKDYVLLFDLPNQRFGLRPR